MKKNAMRFICGNQMCLGSIYNRRKSSYSEKFLMNFGFQLSSVLLKNLFQKRNRRSKWGPSHSDDLIPIFRIITYCIPKPSMKLCLSLSLYSFQSYKINLKQRSNWHKCSRNLFPFIKTLCSLG